MSDLVIVVDEIMSFNNSSKLPDDPACSAIIYFTDTPSRISSAVYVIFSLIFVIIGLVGNVLSVAVFTLPSMRQISSNVYLLVLAISDGLYLVSVFPSKLVPTLICWGVVPPRFDIVNVSGFACVAFQYVDDLFADYSTCMILAFTVERCMAVYLPTRLKQICTVVRARCACVAIFVAVAALISPHHLMYIRLHKDPYACTITEADEAKFTVLYTVESVLFRVLPVVVIASLNVLIIVRIRTIAENKSRLRNNNGMVQPVERKLIGIRLTGCCILPLPTTPQPPHVMEQSAAAHGSLQLTITLIIVSTTYIILHIPVLVHFLLMQLYRVRIIDLDKRTVFTSLNYCRLLYVAGFAINFFLYTVSGSVFREKLFVIFARWRLLFTKVCCCCCCCTKRQSNRARRDPNDPGLAMDTVVQDTSKMTASPYLLSHSGL